MSETVEIESENSDTSEEEPEKDQEQDQVADQASSEPKSKSSDKLNQNTDFGMVNYDKKVIKKNSSQILT